jgi:hypothetical protein
VQTGVEGDIADQAGAPALGVVEGAGQGVHIRGELGELGLGRWVDPLVVVAGGKPARRRPHPPDGTEYPAGDEHRHPSGRCDARQQSERQSKVKGAHDRVVHRRTGAHRAMEALASDAVIEQPGHEQAGRDQQHRRPRGRHRRVRRKQPNVEPAPPAPRSRHRRWRRCTGPRTGLAYLPRATCAHDRAATRR